MGEYLRYLCIFIASLEIFGVVASFCHILLNSQEIRTYYDEQYSNLIIPVSVIINFKLLIGACLLLKGAIEKKPRFLYWLVYNCILAVFCTISTVIIFIIIMITKSENEDFSTYLVIIFAMIFATGIFWAKWTVVYKYYRYLKKNPAINSYYQFNNDNIPKTV